MPAPGPWHHWRVLPLVAIGILGGVLTTLTGVGGGMVALALLTLIMPPVPALAISAAALVVGNGHRMVLFAGAIDRGIAWRFGLGLTAGALVGARFVAALPGPVLQVALIAIAGLALAKALGRRALTPAPRHLTASGTVVGMVGAGAGGAGVLVAPILLGAGLRGEAYVATVASCAIALNGARVIGYGLGGLYDRTMVAPIAGLAAALVAGNLIGRVLRTRTSPRWLARIELSTPVIAIVVTIAGW